MRDGGVKKKSGLSSKREEEQQQQQQEEEALMREGRVTWMGHAASENNGGPTLGALRRGEDDGATRMTAALPFVAQLFVVAVVVVDRLVLLRNSFPGPRRMQECFGHS